MWPPKDKIDALLDLAAEGNAEAINTLLSLCCSPLSRLIESRLDAKIQRRVDANDVLQDALIDISRRLPEYTKTRLMPFPMWVKQIAKDRIIDSHRRHRVSAMRSIDREHVTEEKGPANDGKRHDPCDNLEADVEIQDDDTSRILNGALARLPESYCEIIVMRNHEMLTNKQIAQALGLKEPAVSMRYTRATRALRKMVTLLEAA